MKSARTKNPALWTARIRKKERRRGEREREREKKGAQERCPVCSAAGAVIRRKAREELSGRDRSAVRRGEGRCQVLALCLRRHSWENARGACCMYVVAIAWIRPTDNLWPIWWWWWWYCFSLSLSLSLPLLCLSAVARGGGAGESHVSFCFREGESNSISPVELQSSGGYVVA